MKPENEIDMDQNQERGRRWGASFHLYRYIDTQKISAWLGGGVYRVIAGGLWGEWGFMGRTLPSSQLFEVSKTSVV